MRPALTGPNESKYYLPAPELFVRKLVLTYSSVFEVITFAVISHFAVGMQI